MAACYGGTWQEWRRDGGGGGGGRGGGGRAWGADGHTIGATCCHILPWQQNGSTACSWLFKDGRPCVHVPVIKSSIHMQHTVGLYINVPLGRRRLVSECQSINVRVCVWPVYTITRLDCWLVWTTWLQVTQILWTLSLSSQTPIWTWSQKQEKVQKFRYCEIRTSPPSPQQCKDKLDMIYPISADVPLVVLWVASHCESRSLLQTL